MAESRTLEILVKVKDLATRAIGGIQGTITKFGELAQKAFKTVATGFLLRIGSELTEIPGKLIAAGAAFLETADDVQKLAAALGTTSESLTAMTFAAEQSGLSQADLVRDTKFLVKAIEEARQKSGEQRLAFVRLGIDVNALGDGQLDLVDVYAKLADGIAGVNDPVERSAILMKLLGKSGHEAALLLQEGSAGIRRLAEDAERLGLVLEGGVVKNADRVGDAINSIKGFFRGLLFTVAKEVLPIIAQALEGFVEFLKDHRESVARAMRGVGRVFVAVFDTIVTASLLFAGAIRVTFNSVLAVLKNVQIAFLATEKLLKTPDATGIQQFLFPSIAKAQRLEQEDLAKRIAEAEKELASIITGTGVPALVQYAAEWSALKAKIAAAGKERETFAGKGGGGTREERDFFTGFKEGVDAFELEIENVVKLGRDVATSLLQGAQQNLEGFFNSIITGALSAKAAFKAMVNDMLRLLAQLVAKVLAAQLIGVFFNAPPLTGGSGAGSGSGGGGWSPDPRISRLQGAGGGRGGGFGGGGGPLSSGGGGGATNVYVTIQAVDAASFQGLATRNKKVFEDIFINAIGRRRDVRVAIGGA